MARWEGWAAIYGTDAHAGSKMGDAQVAWDMGSDSTITKLRTMTHLLPDMRE